MNWRKCSWLIYKMNTFQCTDFLLLIKLLSILNNHKIGSMSYCLRQYETVFSLFLFPSLHLCHYVQNRFTGIRNSNLNVSNLFFFFAFFEREPGSLVTEEKSSLIITTYLVIILPAISQGLLDKYSRFQLNEILITRENHFEGKEYI